MSETRLVPAATSPEFVVPDSFFTEDFLPLVGEFIDDFRDRLERIRGALEDLQEADDEERTRGLLKDVHSLKGTGGSMGFQIVTTVCHVFEEFLIKVLRDRVPCDRGRAFDVVERYVDLLAAIQREAAGGARDFNGFVAGLNEAIEASLDVLGAGVTDRTHAEAGEVRPGGANARPLAGRILLVESTTFYHRVVQAALGPSEELTLHAVRRAGEALDAIHEEGYDLIIAARDLDGASGLALLAALRADPATAHLPRILIEPLDAEPLPEGIPAPERTVQKDRAFAERLREAAAALLAGRVPRPTSA